MYFDLCNRLLVEYAVNALWQVPMLTAAGWLLVHAARLGPQGEHRVWLAILVACVVLPLHGISLPKAARAVSVRMPAAVTPTMVSPGSLLIQMPGQDPSPKAPSAAPARSLEGLTRLPMSPATLRNVSVLYAALVSLALVRLVRGVLLADRLLNSSEEYALDEADQALWQKLNDALDLALPASSIRTSDQITSPVVVGILRPSLLVPAGFALCSEPERRAALAHELAHIARRDTLTHAACQVLGLPLIWHPILHAVQTQIARTREMICDAIAARTMDSGFAYAHCLLSLAQRLLRDGSMPQPGAAMGLFRNHKLEERVIRLTEVNPTPTTAQRWIRGGAAVSAVLLTGAAAALVHLTPVLAHTTQEHTQTQSQTAAPATPAAASASPAPLAPPAPGPAAAPQAPVAPAAPQALPAPRANSDGMLQTEPGEVDDRGHSIAIAHGKHGHVILRDGGHIHRWIGADGQPWELMNDQAADLTPQQQRDAEAEYWQKMALAQKDSANTRLKLDSPEFKAQIDSLTKGEVAKQLAELKNMPMIKVDLKDLEAQLQDRNVDLKGMDVTPLVDLKDLKLDPQMKLDLDTLKAEEPAGKHGLIVRDGRIVAGQLSPADQKLIDERMARARRQVKEAMAKMNDPAVAAKIAEAERKAAMASSSEAAKRMEEAQRRMDDATKRLEAATKALEEAQKQLDKK